MILRRITQHVREQNWTAIVIDLVIVILGVFLGIQLGDWNEARDEVDRERHLLVELKGELTETIEQLTIMSDGYDQVSRSGARSVAFLDSGEGCGVACWDVIVDFFHASQWQPITVGRSTYDEMRRNGWPRNRAIVDALETYHRQGANNSAPLNEPPAYRALVRGLIPLGIHKPYWVNCYELKNGRERYIEDCEEVVDPNIAATGVSAIMADPDIHAALTEWAGYTSGMEGTLVDQITTAERAIALIDSELGDR